MPRRAVLLISVLSFLLNPSTPGFAAPPFQIGGINSNVTIAELKTLTGMSIEEIEHHARPCEYTDWVDCSGAGFLGKDESLIARLIIDNTYVLTEGLTHQKLAEPLYLFRDFNVDCEKDAGAGFRICHWRGRQYKVIVSYSFGFQESIFNDKSRTNLDIEVTDQETGKVFGYSGMLPDIIYLYGFYEGDTAYRIAPEEIISFFRIKPDPLPNP